MTEATDKNRIIDLAREALALIRESGELPLPDELLTRAAVAYNMLTRDYYPGPLMQLARRRPELQTDDVLNRALAIAIIASNFADHARAGRAVRHESLWLTRTPMTDEPLPQELFE